MKIRKTSKKRFTCAICGKDLLNISTLFTFVDTSYMAGKRNYFCSNECADRYKWNEHVVPKYQSLAMNRGN